MKRTERVELRVTPTEAENIAANAARLDLTKSQYLRLLATLPVEFADGESASDVPRRVVVIDRDGLNKLFREYRRQGVNFNQGIHALNIIGRNYANPPSKASAQNEVLRLAAKSLANLRGAKEGMDKVALVAEGIYKSVLVPEPSRNSREGV